MEIRNISKLTGVSTKTIRYYEDIELLPSPSRKPNGYRVYSEADEIEIRIQELRKLQKELSKLHKIGLTYPTDDVEGKNCVCHLVSEKSTQMAPWHSSTWKV